MLAIIKTIPYAIAIIAYLLAGYEIYKWAKRNG